MDKMTYKEALQYANENILVFDSNMAEFVDTCKKALEKQIPKKPTNICIRCGFVVEGLCSTCGSAVLPEHKYCSNCSQKINWSDEGRKFENGFMVDDGGTTVDEEE